MHEVARATETSTVVWAWCKVQVDEPGYSEVVFTHDDGHTPADAPPQGLRLGRVLFQVWC